MSGKAAGLQPQRSVTPDESWRFEQIMWDASFVRSEADYLPIAAALRELFGPERFAIAEEDRLNGKESNIEVAW